MAASTTRAAVDDESSGVRTMRPARKAAASRIPSIETLPEIAG